MKRLLVLFMIALLILTSVVGCSDKPKETSKTDAPVTFDGPKEEETTKQPLVKNVYEKVLLFEKPQGLGDKGTVFLR